MTVSCIVTTINKTDELKRLLTSINFQENIDLQFVEVIFIDQGNNKHAIDSFSPNFKLVYIKSGVVGLSAARNIGLTYTQGKIVCFPDDDCWYEPQLFEKMLSLFNINAITGICTLVEDPNNNKVLGNRPKKIINSINYRNIFYLPISVGIFVRSSFISKHRIGFNESFGAGSIWGSGEETIFIGDIINSGGKITYYGTLSVYHPVEEYKPSDVKKFYKYGEGFGATIAYFVNKKKITVLIYFFEIILRSFLGIFVNIIKFKGVNIKIYYNRLIGSLIGFVKIFNQK